MATAKVTIDEKQIEDWIKKGVKKLENMNCDNKKGRSKRRGNGLSCIWFLGFIGSAVYFTQQAITFGGDLAGLLKAIVWPAYLIFHLFSFLRI